MLARSKRWVLDRMARRKYAPDIQVSPPIRLLRLGSRYGGWTMESSPDLHRSTILSCGLGEDATFDVEFASRFDARVIIVDPTPRAILHFEEIQKRIGQPALYGHVKGGKQPAESYDLAKIAKGALILEPSALWIENTTLKFFAPGNPAHVSHSITNLHNDFVSSSPHIEVPAITPESLFEKYELNTVPLMKLDIEGAEVAVIKHMMNTAILPRQLLIEFDEMNYPSDRSKQNAEAMDASLREAGYECRYFDGLANFLYMRR
jgi:FkbM family methyltransferase